MYYGVDYRDYHTAMHGIILFKNEDSAVNACIGLKLMNEDEEMDDEEYQFRVEAIFQSAVDVLEEVDYRDIEPVMKDYYNDEDIKIVNLVAVDLY